MIETRKSNGAFSQRDRSQDLPEVPDICFDVGYDYRGLGRHKAHYGLAFSVHPFNEALELCQSILF